MTGTMRKRGRRVWEIGVSLGKDDKGVRRRKSKTVYGTKAKAQQELRAWVTEVERLRSRPRSVLVGDWLHRYHREVVQPNLKIKTVERYADIIEQNLVPHIGEVQLDQLSPRHIEAAYRELMQAKNGGKGLSGRTIRLIHSVLSGACGYACRMDVLDRNPAPLVGLPKVNKKEVIPPEVKAVRQLLQIVAAEGHPLFEFIHVLVYTGMRKGEAWTLRWCNVDLVDGSIRVLEAAVRTHGHGAVVDSPKSDKSVRTVVLDDLTVAILKQMREEQMQQGRGGLVDLVFPGADGELMAETTMMRQLKQVGSRVGLPWINFHAFRHFHASVTLQDARYLMVVSRRLGHSSIAVTVDTYGHLMKGSQKDTVDAFARALRDTT